MLQNAKSTPVHATRYITAAEVHHRDQTKLITEALCFRADFVSNIENVQDYVWHVPEQFTVIDSQAPYCEALGSIWVGSPITHEGQNDDYIERNTKIKTIV